MLRNLPVKESVAARHFQRQSEPGALRWDLQLGQARLFFRALYKYFRDHRESFEEYRGNESGEVELAVRAGGSGSERLRASGTREARFGQLFFVMGVKTVVGQDIRRDR